MPIITTAEYKAWIGDTSSDYDTTFGVLILAVQDDLETACGRKFDEVTYTDEAYDGKGEQELRLNNYPVSALTAVKLLDSSGTTTTLATTDYRLTGERGRVTRLKSSLNDWGDSGSSSTPVFPDEASNVLVSYTGGYSSENAPAGLKMLMYTLVDEALDRRGENWSLASVSDGIEAHTNMASAEYASKRTMLIGPYTRVVI